MVLGRPWAHFDGVELFRLAVLMDRTRRVVTSLTAFSRSVSRTEWISQPLDGRSLTSSPFPQALLAHQKRVYSASCSDRHFLRQVLQKTFPDERSIKNLLPCLLMGSCPPCTGEPALGLLSPAPDRGAGPPRSGFLLSVRLFKAWGHSEKEKSATWGETLRAAEQALWCPDPQRGMSCEFAVGGVATHRWRTNGQTAHVDRFCQLDSKFSRRWRAGRGCRLGSCIR